MYVIGLFQFACIKNIYHMEWFESYLFRYRLDFIAAGYIQKVISLPISVLSKCILLLSRLGGYQQNILLYDSRSH